MKLDTETLLAFKKELERKKAQDNYMWASPMRYFLKWVEEQLEKKE